MRFAALVLLAILPALGALGGDEAVWDAFKEALLKDEISPDRMRPYFEELQEPMLGFLAAIRSNARPEDWAAEPELHRVGEQLHVVVSPTGADGELVPYCFSFVIDGSDWYFRYLESVFIRLDQVGRLPASRFPDVTEERKAWIRDERHVSDRVRFVNSLTQEKGRDFAMRLFKDGAGRRGELA